MVVELSGPSGVGKSTFAREIVEGLSSEGLEVCSVCEEVFSSSFGVPEFVCDPSKHCWKTDVFLFPYALLSIVLNTRFSIYIIFSIFLSSESFKSKVAISRSVLRKLGMRSYFSRKKFANKIVIIDEGLFHSLHNVFVGVKGEVNKVGVRRFAKLVPLPDVLIILCAPVKKIIKQLEERGNWSPRLVYSDDLRGFVENAVAVFSEVVEVKRVGDRAICLDSLKESGKQAVISIVRAAMTEV